MTERPILFFGAMVRPILSGTKTQTRRVVKSKHAEDADVWKYDDDRGLWESGLFGEGGPIAHGEYVRCPYGAPGDRLWVKESWYAEVAFDALKPSALPHSERGPHVPCWYAADADGVPYVHDGLRAGKLRPSMFMPRWASRIDLEVTEVRVERLHEITEDDARAEGVEPAPFCKAGRPSGMEHVESFERLWADINGAKSWDANPWVWVVTFKRVRP